VFGRNLIRISVWAETNSAGFSGHSGRIPGQYLDKTTKACSSTVHFSSLYSNMSYHSTIETTANSASLHNRPELRTKHRLTALLKGGGGDFLRYKRKSDYNDNPCDIKNAGLLL
jgi:hypothetical protein